jgi:hypothetical protein
MRRRRRRVTTLVSGPTMGTIAAAAFSVSKSFTAKITISTAPISAGLSVPRTALSHHSEVGAPRDEADVFARGGKSRTEVAADSARTHHGDPHNRPLLRQRTFVSPGAESADDCVRPRLYAHGSLLPVAQPQHFQPLVAAILHCIVTSVVQPVQFDQGPAGASCASAAASAARFPSSRRRPPRSPLPTLKENLANKRLI